MANTLKFFRNGAVGFIDWLGARWREYRAVSSRGAEDDQQLDGVGGSHTWSKVF
jgi:hypothetical protein